MQNSEHCCEACANEAINKSRRVRFVSKAARKLARRMTFQGMDISIETDKGQLRHWIDPHNGESGSTKMKFPYGYIRRTDGADGEQVDCYVGPEENVDKVYVIHQMKAPKFTEYDEDKVMLGFESKRQAKNAYLEHYNNEKFFGSMDEMSVDEFKNDFISKSLQMPGPMSKVNPMAAGMMPQPVIIDPDTYEGVEALIGRIGSVKDTELMTIAEAIWGSGYDCQGKAPQQARMEILGFLEDQRDLLGMLSPYGIQSQAEVMKALEPG